MVDFETDGLTGDALEAAKVVLKVIGQADGGGCQAFRAPEDWDGEYGRGSVLILVHDGGDLAAYCNMDYEQYGQVETLSAALNEAGFWMEQCTSWYSAVYKS